MVDKQSDILQRIIEFLPELAEEIKFENGEACITPKGVKILKLKVNPKLLAEIFEEDC